MPARCELSLADSGAYDDTETGLQVSITNRGSSTLTIYLAGFWPNHMLRIVDSEGKEAPRSYYGRSGARAFGQQGRDKNSPWVMDPGEVHRYFTPPPCQPST